MDIQQLVTDIIETMGGVVQPLEYALCQALLPEEYAPRFRGRTEMLLAFDYEVAEENEGADFVTFGSKILDDFMEIATAAPEAGVRFVMSDRLELAGADEKIKKLADYRGNVRVLSHSPVIGMWCVFVFHVHFAASESYDEIYDIWVNMLTGEIDDELTYGSVFCEPEIQASYPYAPFIDFTKAFLAARKTAGQIAEISAAGSTDMSFIKIETERINNYYAEMILENERKINRKGISKERADELFSKRAAIKIEYMKQLNEIRDNLTAKPQFNLLHGITYHFPMLEIKCEFSQRADKELNTYYYEPLTKRFFTAKTV